MFFNFAWPHIAYNGLLINDTTPFFHARNKPNQKQNR
jgi:hypothetical protein